ncbi:BAAT / Acyl-CoA thioester hydrolase C terminal [Agromyces sp. CF514]|uniref:acyl-CoA thioesterase/BAAT N-terminal domain-containing protein n=1 Tax=Agromyces sp. CF514 TaxID=1881031 RepID=UPI0008E03EFD|nr:acyl-CoA thioesterase/BAAT N-terminal domain-containing protein [Agromyces sp. CF514]SFR85724.1 BAAT / Acyl-CoA thioester hydrolase C terminal [Agromyces sp. CF514]
MPARPRPRRGRRVASVALAAALATAALSACTPLPTGLTPSIEVTELGGPFQPLGIRVLGLTPGATVTLRASSDIGYVPHESRAVFTADAAGVIDLARDVPTDGAWTVADPMAPFYSFGDGTVTTAFQEYDREHTVQLEVLDGTVDDGADGIELTSTSVLRGFPEGAFDIVTAPDAGVSAFYATPADLDPGDARPALLVMGGSEGGSESARLLSMQLAALGYPALAVSLFGSPGQPDELAEVPLDPVLEAVGWLRAQPGVDPDRVTPFGVSRGGEVALWLAATHPELARGAILPVGAGELFCGYPDVTRSAWTLDGEPLPCTTDVSGDPPAASVIGVDTVDGPVVLACGTADAVWPSCPLQHRTLERLEGGGVEVFASEGEGASHFVPLNPYLPHFADTDAAADSAARAAFWADVVEALGPAA